MKIVTVEPNKAPYIKEIAGTLKSMQEVVGGYIECVPFGTMHDVVIICNEEGKLKGLEPNFLYGGWDMICGTVFICGTSGEDFVGLTDEQATDIVNIFDTVYR